MATIRLYRAERTEGSETVSDVFAFDPATAPTAEDAQLWLSESDFSDYTVVEEVNEIGGGGGGILRREDRK